MNRITLLFLLSLMPFGCGSRGNLVNPTQDAEALKDSTPIIVHADEGYFRIRLDGSQRTFLTRGDKRPVSASADGNVLAISNPNTDLFVRDLRTTGEPREVVSYRGRLGAVAVSPDGKTLAATRHADFSTPQSTWSDQEDNSIDIISVDSLEVVKTIEPTETGWNYPRLWFGSNGLLYSGGQESLVHDRRLRVQRHDLRRRCQHEESRALRPRLRSISGARRLPISAPHTSRQSSLAPSLIVPLRSIRYC